MSNCGWCGKVINGEPVLTIINSAMVMVNGKIEVEIMPGYLVDFCCHGCAWAFSVETHRLMGRSGKDIRNHLIKVHGLNYPPGKTAGGMRRDCVVVDMAMAIFKNMGKI